MAMTAAHMLLVVGMLVSGSLNTITTNFADTAKAPGTMAPSTFWGSLNNEVERDHLFTHPFFQACCMFAGELLCLLAHKATYKRDAATGNAAIATGSRREIMSYLFPAICDMLGTGIMYAGLCLSYASVFQMLRGASVVFTAAISQVFLKRRQHAFQWFSVLLVVVGIVIVGYVSLGNDSSDDKDSRTVLIGDGLIVLAQLIVAIQMCTEERIMGKYQTPALLAVGLEGLFGLAILGVLLVPMYYVRPGGYPIENVPDALVQMTQNPVIVIAMSGNMLSIAFYNFFGISVTKSLSAAHRMVLDSVRTVVVWAASLALGWEQFHALQVVGFVVMSLGTAMYNEIITLPAVFTYPSKEPSQNSELSYAEGGIAVSMVAVTDGADGTL